MATLTDIVEQLKINNVGIENTSKNIDALVKGLERSRLDNLEDKLDKQRARKPVVEKSRAFQAGESVGSFSFIGLPNPANLLAPLLAGVTAFGAGIAGLRGWEAGAISSIGDGIRSLSNTAIEGARNLRTSLLGRIFGIEVDPKTGLANTGRTTKSGLQVYASLDDVVGERLRSMRTSFLNVFGIGADGKPIQDPANKLKVSATGSFITTVTERINKLLSPLMKVSAGIADFIKGAGSGLFKFLDPFISGARGFASMFSKILWPIGVIMSIFDGVGAYRETNGDQYDKITAGISAAIGDFIGAPLDLLKSLLAWTLKKFGFDETAETITNFSIETKITDLFNGIFGMARDAFEWLSSVFKGEKSIGEIMSDLWTTWLGGVATIGDWVWNKAIKPITEWFAEKLGFDITLPELDIMTMLTDTYDRIKTSFLSSMESLAIWFMTMPQKIGLALEEEWIMAIATLKSGFAKFGNWISGLPDAIFIGAIEKLKEIVPDWASRRLGLDEAIASGAGREAERAQNFQAALERIDTSTASQLRQLNDRRRDLETYEQQLLDARQYNTTTVNSGGIVMDATTPTTDPLGGGSAYAFVGGR